MWKYLSTWMSPQHPARYGSALAALILVFCAFCLVALNIDSGFGRWVDFAFTGILALFGIPLASLVIALFLYLVRLVPPLLAGFYVACLLLITLVWFRLPGLILAIFLLVVECTLGATLAIVVRGQLRGAPSGKRVLVWTILLCSVSANLWLIRLLSSIGVEDDPIDIKQPKTIVQPLNVPDPSLPGPYRVKKLYYGSGDSLRRAEFGPSVAIRTPTVDAAVFFEDFAGWKAWLRKAYWGFGIHRLPLNATVFYPDGPGPFPLFLIAHGNHRMSVASDAGYDYLCRLLASRGFIAVSIDENFLNSSFAGELPKQQAVRGWLILEHLRLWHQWVKNPSGPFYKKFDVTRIAVAGHSRGGEAAATAALLNTFDYYPDNANLKLHYGFQIKSIIAIAPPDGQYKPAESWRELKDVNYLTLQGANDADVASFMGSRQYDHIRFSGDVPAFKSELYIYGANHNQFNTTWSEPDSDQVPQNWFWNSRPLLTGDQQRRIAKVYISAFLESTLHDKSEYAELFRDYRKGRNWIPKTLYTNRFADQDFKTICKFDEDADLTTTTMPGGKITAQGLTVWKEGKIPFRNGSRDYNGVFLGWNWTQMKTPGLKPPSYSVTLPTKLGIPTRFDADSLVFSVAPTDEEAPLSGAGGDRDSDDRQDKPDDTNFTIEVQSANGECARVEVNRFALLLPPPHVQFTKLEELDRLISKDATEPVFQTIQIPFSAFEEKNARFDPKSLRSIRLIFDKTHTKVIIISEIGLEGN